MKRGYFLGLASGILLATLPLVWRHEVQAQSKKPYFTETPAGEIPDGYGVLKGVAGTAQQLALVFEDANTKSIFILEFNGSKIGTQVKKIVRTSN